MSRTEVLTDDQGDEVASKYRKGASITALATEYRCSTAPILRALRMREVVIRLPGETRKLGAALHGRIR